MCSQGACPVYHLRAHDPEHRADRRALPGGRAAGRGCVLCLQVTHHFYFLNFLVDLTSFLCYSHIENTGLKKEH